MDAPTVHVPTAQHPTITLTPLGDPTAAACEGEFCTIPEHHEQAVVNRKLDEDAV